MATLEAKMAQDGLVSTERQLVALEKQEATKEAYGEIDTAHPGYLGCQAGAVQKAISSIRNRVLKPV